MKFIKGTVESKMEEALHAYLIENEEYFCSVTVTHGPAIYLFGSMESKHVDLARAKRDNIPVVRGDPFIKKSFITIRDAVTFHAKVPLKTFDGIPRGIFPEIGSAALNSLGIPAEPFRNDILLGGKKISGTAHYRGPAGFPTYWSIASFINFDNPTDLFDYILDQKSLPKPIRVIDNVAGIRDSFDISTDDLVQALEVALKDRIGAPSWEDETISKVLLSKARKIYNFLSSDSEVTLF